jgi:molybdate transport system ATP-binding protein
MALEVRIRHRLGGFALEAEFAAAEGVTALFGPSGSGKTSIVRAVAGLLHPLEGRIAIAGRVVLDTAQRLFVRPEKRRTGLVFQDARLFPHLTVENNLLYGWRRAAAKAPAEEIARVIALLGLEGLRQRMPRHLSGGEKSRVALGRALLAAPEILLLDEPLASLDAGRRAEILPWLEKLRDQRIPMLYVSHALDEVARLADRVVMLKDGRVTAAGPVFDMLTGLHPGQPPLGAVLDVVVTMARADGLSELAFDGGVIAVSTARTKGERLRIRVAAEDILIAREQPRAISANNILPVTISAVAQAGEIADVEMLCGGVRLVARITAASARRLELAEGAPAWAIIKSVTVDRTV